MPLFTVDLHNHSPLVVGDYKDVGVTAGDMAESILQSGIDVFALTDHFSVDFYRPLADAVAEMSVVWGRRMLLLPGAELKVRSRDDEAHVIAIFPPEEPAERFAKLLTRLEADVDSDVDLHRVVLPRDPAWVAEQIVAAGGICTVGHCDREFGEYRLMGRSMLGWLLAHDAVSAVELLDPEARGELDEYDLPPVPHLHSSDSHSLREIGRRTTRLELPELTFEGLREGLAAERERLRAAAKGLPA